MLRRLAGHIRQNAVAWLALFVALGGTGAYAANTIGSTDIIDGQVKSVDVGDAEIKSADVKDESLTTFDVSTFLGADVVDETLTGADVQNGSLGTADIAELHGSHLVLGSVDGSKLKDESITTSDVKDHGLKAVDIAKAQYLRFDAYIPNVDSGRCRVDNITGLAGLDHDHLLLTPEGGTTRPFTYNIETGVGQAFLKTCNHSTVRDGDFTTQMNLLVFDAG